MCKAIEDMRNEAIQEGRADTLKEALENMIKNGINEEQAKKILGLA